jgi:CheY-like chemotaxis protein
VSDADDRQTSLRTLRSSGYHVVEATWRATSDVVSDGHVDLVLIDIRARVFTRGMQLVRQFKHDGTTSHIPIVVLTGACRFRDKQIAIEAGASDVLEMPLSTASVKSVARRLLWAASSGVRPMPISVRACPRCGGVVVRRDRWPVLTSELGMLPDGERHQRMRYAAGWFCTDPVCGYAELA